MNVFCRIKFMFRFQYESIYFDLVEEQKLDQLEIGMFKITLHEISILHIHT